MDGQMIRILVTILLLASTPAWAVTQWNKALPASGDNLTAFPAAINSQWSIMDTLLAGYRKGESLQFSSSTTLTVTSGQLVASNAGATLRIFLTDAGNSSLTTANLDVGGSFSNGTQYYVYAGATSATAASSTYYISLSSTAPTGPTYYVQLGNFTTNGAGGIANIVDNATPHFGTLTAKTYNTTYQALTDGIVNVTMVCASSTCGAYTIGYTDSSSSPSTALAMCSVNYPSGGENDLKGQYNSFEMRVKAGDYYKASLTTNVGALTTTVYFTPIQ